MQQDNYPLPILLEVENPHGLLQEEYVRYFLNREKLMQQLIVRVEALEAEISKLKYGD